MSLSIQGMIRDYKVIKILQALMRCCHSQGTYRHASVLNVFSHNIQSKFIYVKSKWLTEVVFNRYIFLCSSTPTFAAIASKFISSHLCCSKALVWVGMISLSLVFCLIRSRPIGRHEFLFLVPSPLIDLAFTKSSLFRETFNLFLCPFLTATEFIE